MGVALVRRYHRAIPIRKERYGAGPRHTPYYLMKNLLPAFLPAFLALSSLSPVHGASLVVGGPGDPNTGDCAILGCAVEMQQIYDASLFSGPVTITSITFFNTNYLPGEVASANYNIYFSTTTTAIDSLSSLFSDNLGIDNTLFFGGALGGLIGPTNKLTITGTPFAYDPSMGNLLLSMNSDGLGEDYSVYLDFVAAAPANTMSRAWGSTLGFADEVSNNAGLVTEFGFTAETPEPGTNAMMLLGTAAIFLLYRRQA